MSEPKVQPKGEKALRALPEISDETAAGKFLLRDFASDHAVVGWRDETGVWEPVYLYGQWWKKRLYIP